MAECFPGGSDCKETACNAGDPGSIAESGRFPGEGNSSPLSYSCLEKSHGQRCLEGTHRVGDMIEQLTNTFCGRTMTATTIDYMISFEFVITNL